jgi:hypothetical protein
MHVKVESGNRKTSMGSIEMGAHDSGDGDGVESRE